MEDLVMKIQQNIKKWPKNFPCDIGKNEFFNYLKEYHEIVKPIPKTILENTGAENSDVILVKKDKSPQKIIQDTSSSLGNPTRVQKIQQLQEKLNALKGKSLNVVGSLKRKGLKNRLKKKMKKEERMNAKGKKNNILKENKFSNSVKKSDQEQEEHIKKENKQNDIVYSKFDFPNGIDEESKKKKGPTDPMRILQKVEKSRKKLHEMEARGRNAKVKKIKESLAWEAAIQKAEGQKVKDDVELLKKSIRKKTNLKNRSKKKWEERENHKVQKMEEVQRKRKTNIQNKKKEKQKKKVKKLIKKGRIIP